MTGTIPHPRGVQTNATGGQPALAAMFLCSANGSSWQSRLTSAAQALTRDGSRYTHCGIHVGHGRIVHADARTGRAVLDQFERRYGHREVLWSDAPIQRHLAELPWAPAEDDVRERVAAAALALVDAPYAWSDYLAIAADEWRWRGRVRIGEYADRRGHLTCSALVVRAYRMAGIEVFAGRRPGLATPGDLALLDEVWVRARLADLETRVTAIEERLS